MMSLEYDPKILEDESSSISIKADFDLHRLWEENPEAANAFVAQSIIAEEPFSWLFLDDEGLIVETPIWDGRSDNGAIVVKELLITLLSEVPHNVGAKDLGRLSIAFDELARFAGSKSQEYKQLHEQFTNNKETP